MLWLINDFKAHIINLYGSVFILPSLRQNRDWLIQQQMPIFADTDTLTDTLHHTSLETTLQNKQQRTKHGNI